MGIQASAAARAGCWCCQRQSETPASLPGSPTASSAPPPCGPSGKDSFFVAVTGHVSRGVSDQREQFILVNSTRPLHPSLLVGLLPGTDAPLPAQLEKHRFAARLNQDTDSPLQGPLLASIQQALQN